MSTTQQIIGYDISLQWRLEKERKARPPQGWGTNERQDPEFWESFSPSEADKVEADWTGLPPSVLQMIEWANIKYRFQLELKCCGNGWRFLQYRRVGPKALRDAREWLGWLQPGEAKPKPKRFCECCGQALWGKKAEKGKARIGASLKA